MGSFAYQIVSALLPSLCLAAKSQASIDRILTEYPPYNIIAPLIFNTGAANNPSDKNDSTQAQTVEKWLLVGFCSICVLAMVVCIIILIVYKIKKSRQNRNAQENDVRVGPPTNPSRARQPRQGSSSRSRDKSSSQQNQVPAEPHYMIPPLSTVSEKSEILEASMMGSALSRSFKSRGVSADASLHNQRLIRLSDDHRGSSHVNNTQMSLDQTAEAQANQNILDMGMTPEQRMMSPVSQSVHLVKFNGSADQSAPLLRESVPLLRETFEYENTSMQQQTHDGGSNAGGSVLDTNHNVKMTIYHNSTETFKRNDSSVMEGD